MEINGREVKFAMTVWAQIELEKICPAGKLENIGQLLGGLETGENLENCGKVLCILSMAHENKMLWANANSYEKKPLVIDEVLTLDNKKFMELMKEALAAFRGDSEVTVEVADEKSPKKEDAPAALN